MPSRCGMIKRYIGILLGIGLASYGGYTIETALGETAAQGVFCVCIGYVMAYSLCKDLK